MKLIRYVPSFRGIKVLRDSRPIDEMLEERALHIAAAAQDAYALVTGEDVIVDVLQEGSDTKAPRARVAVIGRYPAALRIEAEHRVLGGSLDAARG